MKSSLNFLCASKLAAMIRAGEITSRQTAETFIAQVKKQNSTYNAIVTLNEVEALAQADQADQALRDGKPCGPLHGVPITIKDTYRVKGSRTTAGKRFSDRRLLKVAKVLASYIDKFQYPLQKALER